MFPNFLQNGRGHVFHPLMVECARQPGMLVGALPVHNRIADQKVKRA
jgi:hypothetical protein